MEQVYTAAIAGGRMSFCTTCGGEQEAGTRFCTSCGTKANVSESVGSGSAVQPAPEVTLPGAPQAAPVLSATQSYPESPYCPDAPKQTRGGLSKAVVIV